jgi:divalent metal cation (Fe/Co/Zn/Cd) transporter
VRGVGAVRVRWIGHRMRAECEIVVDPELTVVQAHAVAVEAEHSLLHAVPRLGSAIVHADPEPVAGSDHHEAVAHHREELS